MSSIEDRIARLSPAQRALLDKRLRDRETPPGGRPSRGEAEVILSSAQERLWFLARMEPDSPAYNIASAFHVRGALDCSALEKAISAVVARHEVLRTRIREEGGRPFGVVTPAEQVRVPVIPIDESRLRQVMAAEARRPFDMAHDPMLRTRLLRLGAEEHVLLLCIHHIASDAASMRLLREELSELYDAHVTGREPLLAPLPFQYPDYARAQREWLQSAALHESLRYWKRQLAGADPVLELPADRPRAARRGDHGARARFGMDAGLTAELKRWSAGQGVTLFMTLLAGFQILLGRYTGRTDIITGAPAANRDRLEFENLIGFFVNTLVLRTDLSGDPDFVEVIRRTRETALGAYANQSLPFERLVAELQPDRTLRHSPLVQVMLVLYAGARPSLRLPGLEVQPLPLDTGTSKFDLILSLTDEGSTLAGSLEYDTDLFDGATIERMAEHFQTLLGDAASHPDRRISELNLLPAAERSRLLAEWNPAAFDPPAACVHQLFEQQAGRSPDAVAVAWSGGEVTYSELNRRADLLASGLASLGVGRDMPVALCLERSPAMVVAILAVLKAGGAWLPLDPTYPSARLSFMLQDSGAGVVIAHDNLRTRLGETAARFISVDLMGSAQDLDTSVGPRAQLDPDSLAYIIYTSGSTGQPKGVEVPHGALANHMRWMGNEFPLSPQDRVVQRAPFSFDASVWEFFAPLLAGATAVLASEEDTRDPRLLTALVQRHQATILQVVPSLLPALVEHDKLSECRSLRRIFCGGEPLPADQVRRLLSRLPAQVVNLYGPTEACIETTFHVCDGSEPDGIVTIGRPISNVRAYVLDSRGQPCPIGVPGELYLGGACLARGYRGRPDLTAERFVPDPFAGDPGARMYKTGDVARIRANGQIDHMGRQDGQVKVRGFRIELDEITAVMNQHPSVLEAALAVRQDGGGSTYLAAYWVPREAPDAGAGDLRSFLALRLPDYMVPSRYTVLESLPRTPNGKLDRRALPEPDAPAPGRATVGPRNRLEAELVHIWEGLLGIKPVGVTDSFFELGGHSLLAVRLCSEMEKVFKKPLPLATLFEAPTIEHLARLAGDESWAPSWSSLVPVQTAGTRPPLFCVHGALGNILFYERLAKHLGPDQPFYALQSAALSGHDHPARTIEEMAAAYVAEIRTVQPEGPYYLGGFCSGAYIALAMAQQLGEGGSEVALLASFNTDGNWKRVVSMADGLRYHLDNLSRLPAGGKAAYILSRIRYRTSRAGSAMRRLVCRAYLLGGVRLPAGLTSFYIDEANRAATEEFSPRPYHGKVVYFQGSGDSFRDPRPFWSDLVGARIETELVPGRGAHIFQEPNVEELARRLQAHMT